MKTVQLGTVSVIHETWLPYAAACLISYCNKIPETPLIAFPTASSTL